jgi:hypothetical protein
VAELELTRSRDDRRRYELEGVGSLRLQGWMSRGATAEVEGRSWAFARRGFWRTVIVATDADGGEAGAFQAAGLKRGGTLRWGDRELQLRPASFWRERYALAEGDHELALFDGKSWGKRPVRITVEDPATPDPGLVLFCAFVVRGLAEDADAAAGGAAAAGAAATGG